MGEPRCSRPCSPLPRAPHAAAAELTRLAMLAHALPVLTATALRHRHRTHAACIAAPHAPCRCELSRSAAAAKEAVRPVLALQPQRLPLGCARGHCLRSPQPSREPQRYAPSSPQAASGFRALRAAHRSGPLLHLPRGGTPQGTLSAQQSADRSMRPDGQVAPASCWAASTVYSPVGPRNEPSLRFGLLALAPSAPKGHKVCSRLRPLHTFFSPCPPKRSQSAGCSRCAASTAALMRPLPVCPPGGAQEVITV